MTDPRLVEPQRAVPPDPGACGTHRYWCAKRITALVLALLVMAALVTGVWWWVR